MLCPQSCRVPSPNPTPLPSDSRKPLISLLGSSQPPLLFLWACGFGGAHHRPCSQAMCFACAAVWGNKEKNGLSLIMAVPGAGNPRGTPGSHRGTTQRSRSVGSSLLSSSNPAFSLPEPEDAPVKTNKQTKETPQNHVGFIPQYLLLEGYSRSSYSHLCSR